MGKKVYINGRYKPSRSASVSVFDRGLAYGDGLFETMKARRGRIFLLKEHLKRLSQGARALEIPRAALKDIGKRAERLLELNGHASGKAGEAYVKIILTRGPDTPGLLAKGKPRPTVIITTNRLNGKTLEAHCEAGVSAVLVDGLGPLPGLGGLKSLNFLPNVMGKMDAASVGADEGIFTTPDGKILEGTSSNIFIVKKNVLMTPPVDGIVAGITRAFVMRLAGRSGIRVRESSLYTKDLLKSDEAFVTNSVIEVAPLVRVGSKAIGTGVPGPITKRLRDSYRRALLKASGG